MFGIINPVWAGDKLLSNISFGSCAKQDKPQPIWDAIVAKQPELFLMIGDNIYGDTMDMSLLKAKWDQLGQQPGYQKLKAVCPVQATWDDHDYGINDAGADNPKRKQSQQLFLDFFEVPANDPRRSREGVYTSELHGPVGKQVQIILLDTRYFRSPLEKGGYVKGEPGEGKRGIYGPTKDSTTTMLGEAQWTWLKEQLLVPAEVRILATSIQAVPEENGWETWSNFPHERQRLWQLIRSTKANGVVLISGDRHLAEISRLDPSVAGYPLYDVTSSSLNAPSPNKTTADVRFANEINRHRVGLTYFETNFGMIKIDWTLPDPQLRLQVCDEVGGVMLQQRVSLSELQSPK
jgi:alkaline phosphatase D